MGGMTPIGPREGGARDVAFSQHCDGEALSKDRREKSVSSSRLRLSKVPWPKGPLELRSRKRHFAKPLAAPRRHSPSADSTTWRQSGSEAMNWRP
jgi:hypothetical protein